MARGFALRSQQQHTLAPLRAYQVGRTPRWEFPHAHGFSHKSSNPQNVNLNWVALPYVL
jgi:hypothetical protein